MEKWHYRIYIFIAFCCMFTIVSSCSSRQDALNQLEILSEELQKNSSTYTTEEWESAINEMCEIENIIEQNQADYTEDELKEIGRLKGICLAQFTKYSVQSFTEKFKNTLKEAEGFIEGFTKEINED